MKIGANRLGAVLLVAACSGAVTPGTNLGEFEVGPEGRTISFLNGDVVLVFPAGAVSGPVTITVATASNPPAAPTLVSGSAVTFGPSGTTFLAPVSVSLAIPATLPTGVQIGETALYRAGTNSWAKIAGSGVVNGRIEGSVTGFSTFGILGEPATSVSITSAPASIEVQRSGTVVAVAQDASAQTLPNRVINWSSSDNSVATVNTSGGVSGVGVGTVTITAETEGNSATVDIPIVPASGNPGAPWWEWDPSGYGSASDLLNDGTTFVLHQDQNQQFITLDDTPTGEFGGTGTKAMRYDFPGNASLRCQSSTVGRNVGNFPDATHRDFWIEMYVKFEAGFDVLNRADGCSTPSDYKWIFLLVPDGGGRWDIRVWGSDTDQTMHWDPPDNSTDPKYSNQNNRVVAKSTDLFGDGAWHQLRMHMSFSSDENTADGIQVVWVDGFMHTNVRDITVRYRNLANTAANRIFRGMALGRNLDGLRDVPQSLWWGRISIWVADPGWGG